jgi:hypoxanthine phosphoribosyltransferase
METILSLSDFNALCKQLAKKVSVEQFDKIIAIANGGIPVAEEVNKYLKLPISQIYISFYDGKQKRDKPIIDGSISSEYNQKLLIIDDLIDSGDTAIYLTKQLKERNIKHRFACLYQKPHAKIKADYFVKETSDWIVFPREQS